MADVVVHIDDAKITAMSLPGGMVWRWAYQRRQRVEHAAVALAPRRTGHLAESISASYDPGPPDHVIMRVSATAPYAKYVHEGTRTPILPRRGRYLRLRAGNGYPVLHRMAVRGQRSQPFLREALESVMSAVRASPHG